MPDPLRYLLGGFTPAYNQAAGNYLQQQRQSQLLAAQEQERLRKEQQALEQQNTQDFNIRALLSGQMPQMELTQTPLSIEKTGQPLSLGNVTDQYRTVQPELRKKMVLKDLSSEQKAGLLLGLDKEGLGRYQSLNKIFNPAPEKQQPPFEYQGKLYRRGADGSIDFSQPIDVPGSVNKVSVSLGTMTEQGKLLELKGYLNPDANEKDASTRIINGEKYTVTDRQSLGNIKKLQSSIGINKNKIDDPEKYNKFLNKYLTEANQIDNLSKQYIGTNASGELSLNSAQQQLIRDQANNRIMNAEVGLYNTMPDNLKKYIDKNYYSEAKKIASGYPGGKLTIQQFENLPEAQGQSRERFKTLITNDWQNNKLSDEEYRTLALWLRFKFGYLKNINATE